MFLHLLEHTESYDDQTALLRSSSYNKSFVSVRYYRLESNVEVNIFAIVYLYYIYAYKYVRV